MSARTIAIGDIHGCADALCGLLAEVRPRPQDIVIQLGDFIDRGSDSRQVIDRLIALSHVCRLIVLRGDHEEMLLKAIDSRTQAARWLRNGGNTTLKSYGWVKGGRRRSLSSWIPDAHLKFLQRTVNYYETDDFIFVHAGYVPETPMSSQPALALRWRVCNRDHCEPHFSGKTVIAGHTAQRSGEILDLEYLKCIDTNCVRGGWLTAFDATDGSIWQVDREGRPRAM